MRVLSALGSAGRPYRCTYSSHSLLGLVAAVRAGLAVAGLALCSVPPSLRVIGQKEGLPALEDLEIALVRNDASRTAAVERLEEFLHRALSRNT